MLRPASRSNSKQLGQRLIAFGEQLERERVVRSSPKADRELETGGLSRIGSQLDAVEKARKRSPFVLFGVTRCEHQARCAPVERYRCLGLRKNCLQDLACLTASTHDHAGLDIRVLAVAKPPT